LRRGKGTKNEMEILRIISEQTLEIDEELWVCIIDWQQALDCVRWTKLKQILKEKGISWRERRLVSKRYMDRCVKVRLDQQEARSVKTGRGLRKGC
jgi:hypothetical protein